MKKVLISLIFLTLSTSVAAQNTWTHSRIGSSTLSTDSYGRSVTTMRIGDSYIHSGDSGYSATSSRIGNTWTTTVDDPGRIGDSYQPYGVGTGYNW